MRSRTWLKRVFEKYFIKYAYRILKFCRKEEERVSSNQALRSWFNEQFPNWSNLLRKRGIRNEKKTKKHLVERRGKEKEQLEETKDGQRIKWRLHLVLQTRIRALPSRRRCVDAKNNARRSPRISWVASFERCGAASCVRAWRNIQRDAKSVAARCRPALRRDPRYA